MACVEARKDSHRIMSEGHFSTSKNNPLVVEKLDSFVERRPGGHYFACHLFYGSPFSPLHRQYRNGLALYRYIDNIFRVRVRL
jgi:hypothetical protein